MDTRQRSIEHIPEEIESRIRDLADNPAYRSRIAAALAAVDRGELGRVVRKGQP